MKLSHEHQELYRTVKKFVDEELNPHVDEWEAAGIFPAHEVMKKLGDLGVLGITRDPQYGGLGLDYTYEVVFAQAIGNCTCGSVPMAIGVQTDMATPALARFGSHELRKEYLEPAIRGDMVCSIAVSEASAGSDVAGIKTTARKEGGDYVLNGSKMWITNGTQADWACMLVNTGEGRVHQNKSLIIVPLDANGIDRQTKLDKLGMRSSDTALIFLDNVRVPQRNLVGQEGMGFMYQMLQFQEERLYGAASLLDGMQNVLRETIEYAGQRQAFGQSILDNQFVHFRLAELRTEVEALKALVWHTTEEYVSGRPSPEQLAMLASMCKLKAGRLARELGDACLQFWGGQGFMWESHVARFYRDSRLLSIGGGADEIMLGIIAKVMGILPSRKRDAAARTPPAASARTA
jgi:citronellyl-CoA dehydrogenase